jgi:hypothetical protein
MSANGQHESTPVDSRTQQLATLLGAGLTYAEAGEKVGLSEQTVYRRMKDPAFRALVESERSSHTETIVERLTVLSRRALDRLERVLTSDQETTSNQVRAAGLVLAELGRRTVPTTVHMSGTLDVQQIENMTAEEVRDELERIGTEIARLTGRTIEPGEGGTPTEHVWDVDDVPAGAAEGPSEPPSGPDDPEATGAAEIVSEAQEASVDSDSGEAATGPEEAAPGNVVPLPRPGWQPDPRRVPNPWRGTDPAATSIWPL